MATTPDQQVHALFPLDELPPGQIRHVAVDGLRLVVVHTADGEVHALRDTCPHRGAPLSLGFVQRLLDADEDGRYCLTDRVVLRCPWHGYEFDVDTGLSIADPDHLRVRTYDVRVDDGMVVVVR
jgi:nitrite reductase/ring-hydroxylating ferredoxin subunit